MKYQTVRKILAAGIAMTAAGCGSVPDALLDVVRASARDAIVEAIDETVHGLVDEFVDLENLPLPINDDEENQ